MSTQDSASGGFSAEDQTTSILPTSATRDSDGKGKPAPVAHAGMDLGLLVLRLVLGGTVGAHGLHYVFGVAGGPGIGGFSKVLQGFGYHGPLTVLSWIAGVTEVAGGALLVLGLFTPLAAAAILGVMSNIIFVKFSGGYFIGPAGQGYEYEFVLAAAAFALLFSGPGRVALDKGRRWYRFASAYGTFGLLLAAAASVVVLVLYH